MKYTSSLFRSNLRLAFNQAATGERIEIERYGEVFYLTRSKEAMLKEKEERDKRFYSAQNEDYIKKHNDFIASLGFETYMDEIGFLHIKTDFIPKEVVQALRDKLSQPRK